MNNLKELFETLNKGNEILKHVGEPVKPMYGDSISPLFTSIRTKINSTAKEADSSFKNLIKDFEEQLALKGSFSGNPVSVHSFIRDDNYVVEYVYPEYVAKDDITLEVKKEDTYSLITFAIKHKDTSERENAEHITSHVKSTLSFNHQFIVKNNLVVDDKEYSIEHNSPKMDLRSGKIELNFPVKILKKEDSIIKFM
jgi:hypothetical protein